MICRLERGAEERQPGDVIEMRVGEKQIGVDHRPLGIEAAAAHAQAGAGIEDQEMLATTHLEAGGIAALAHIVRPRAGDRAAYAPKFQRELARTIQRDPSCGSEAGRRRFSAAPAVTAVTE